MANTHVVLNDVVKKYGARNVLSRVSLEIEEGQFVALLGPSGCGKTTMLSAIAGLVPIEEGQISIGGNVVSSASFTLPPEERKIGMVFQDFALWPHLTVFDNIAFGLRVRKMNKAAIAKRVEEVLEQVALPGYEKLFPHQLSGGQKQRVAIARALAPGPALMLMDEPLSSLDAGLREQMRWELRRITQEAQITTIYVTHDQTEALSMADHIVLMHNGVVEQQGAPEPMYKRPHTAFTATFLGAANLLSGRVIRRTAGRVAISCHGVTMEGTEEQDLGDEVTLVIRPQDMVMTDCDEARGLPVIVRQRAYHGAQWQYRLELATDGSGQMLECWSPVEWATGSQITLQYDVERCLAVARKTS